MLLSHHYSCLKHVSLFLFLLYLSFWLFPVFCHHINFICVTKKTKNSTEFWKKPLCFMSFLLLLSHYFTNCYFSFSLKGSPFSLLYCTKSSIFSPFPLKPIPAWCYSEICLLLLLLYGCSKPVAPYSSLDRKYEVQIWFMLLISPYLCPVTQITRFCIFSSLLCQWWGEITVLLHIQTC